MKTAKGSKASRGKVAGKTAGRRPDRGIIVLYAPLDFKNKVKKVADNFGLTVSGFVRETLERRVAKLA